LERGGGNAGSEEKRREGNGSQLTGGWAAFIMPLYKRKLYTLMKPPKDLKLDEQVFQVRFTKEIFRQYQYPPPPPPSFPPLDCRFFLFFFFFFCCSGFFFVFDSCKLWTFVLVVACCCKRMYHQKNFHFSLNFFAACHCKDTCSRHVCHLWSATFNPEMIMLLLLQRRRGFLGFVECEGFRK
jgi:hypothetical protein